MAGTSRVKPTRGNAPDALEPRLMFAADDLLSASLPPGIGQPAQVTNESPLSLDQIHAITGVDLAHERQLTGLGQTVVVIDSGIAYDHPALGGGFGEEYRVVGGWDFTEENDANPYDDGPAGFHGTHVAGIIGSSDAVHQGVAPDVDLVALRVFNDQGRGKLSWLENSLQWVVENQNSFESPITTVNLSIGTNWNSLTLPEYATLEDEFQQLEQMGIFVTVAAGNGFVPNQPGLSYPAVSPHVMPAASQFPHGPLSAFSQRQDRVLVAPGEQITSTVPDYLEDFNGITDDFYAASGTSMASPYLAGASVLVRQAMQQAGLTDISVAAIRNVLTESARSVFDSVTHQTYRELDVGAAVQSVLDVRPQVMDAGYLSAPTTLTIGRQATQVEFISAYAGLWSVEVASESFTINGAADVHRDNATITVDASESIRIDLPRSVDGRLVRISPLATVRSDTLWLQGTDEGNRFELADSLIGTIDGFKFDFAGQRITHVTIDGNGGHDQLALHTYGDGARFRFAPNSLNVSDINVGISAMRFERIDVFAEGVGDIATFVGSATVDQFFAKPTHSWMKNGTYLNYVRGAETVVAWGNDNRDQAQFFDSAGADRLMTLPNRASMQGSGFYNHANGFSQITVHSEQGGDDVANLVGSKSDDVAVVRPENVSLRGDGYVNFVSGFESVAVDGNGGHDTARLYDSVGDDVFVASATSHVLTTADTVRELRGFSKVEAFSTGGEDLAQFHGSRDADRFFAKPTHSWMSNQAGQLSYARGFERVEATGNGGDDFATLFDSPATGEELVHGRDDSTFAGSGFRYDVSAFEVVYGISAGNDRVTFRSGMERDQFFASPALAKILMDQGVANIAEGFDEVVIELNERLPSMADTLLAALSSTERGWVLTDDVLRQIAASRQIIA